MPPKKPDPEAKQAEYDTFKESDEYMKVCEIADEINNNLTNMDGKHEPFVSEVSEDFHVSGKHQVLWDKLYELAVEMKVKPPFKKLEHEWFRSSYFGQKIKVDKDAKIYTLDGVVCEFEPEYADAQRNIKQCLHKRITNLIKQKDEYYDFQNYAKTRAQVKKGFQQLFSLLKSYTKKPFKIIYQQKFMQMLKPFSDLLQINMKLVLYEIKYDTQDDEFINDFKRKAIVQRYCQCLEQVLHILMVYHQKPIKRKIKPANIFKKLDYRNLTKVEQFYLTPFRNAFEKMKKDLCAQFTTGINFWKVPIQKNKVFVTNLQNLVDWQLVTERHFGNPLLRDQINFMVNSLESIDKANQLTRKYLLTKDLNSIEISIPKLVSFKTIQYMRNYKDKQFQIQLKEEQRKRILGISNIKQQNEEEDQVAEKSLGGSPSNTKNNFSKITESQEKPKPKGMKLLKKDSIEEQKQMLGRYWVWQNYCDNQFKDKTIEDGVQKLKHINKAVQLDIEDSIVREGMLPRKDRHNEQRIQARETLKNMKTYDNAQKSKNMRRPPELWNFPDVLVQEHKFRSIAEPKKCYIDGRIEDLDEVIQKIGNHMRTHDKVAWNQIIRRVIDFFANTPDQDPVLKQLVQ